jgi:UDP-N-acetylmuramate dehydrogenase
MFFEKERAYEILHPHFHDRVRLSETLAAHCSFAVGGPADIWLTLTDNLELESLIRICTTHRWPLLLVGAGRNIIFADSGVRGIVARFDSQHYEIETHTEKESSIQAMQRQQGSQEGSFKESSVQAMQRQQGPQEDAFTTATLIADAGVHWSQLLQQLQPLGWAGLEFGIGIPGTLGAGLVSNAGAHNQELGQILEWIEVLDARGCNTGDYDVFVPIIRRRYAREDLDLGNRHSRFRVNRYTHLDTDGKLIFPTRQMIEPAEIVLQLGLHLQYEDPQLLAARCKQYIQERQAHEPALPRTGPIFKDSSVYLAKDLIAQAGLAGKIHGKAQVAEKNANYITNTGGATAAEIMSLITTVHQRVLAQCHINLMLNVEILGEWPEQNAYA